MHRAHGFTLVELMVVLAIVAILSTMAAPSLRHVLLSTTMSSTVNAFLADLRYARSESIRRGGGVTMCRSDAPEAASPACAHDSGAGSTGWISGWVIFYNPDNHGDTGFADTLLRVHSPIAALNAISDANPMSSRFRFTATGRLLNADAATTLQFGAQPTFAASQQRTVCINPGGRARIAGDGTAGCGSGQ